MRVVDWNETNIALLTADWAAGLTCGEISRLRGWTPSTIQGKAHRLHLPGRPSPIRRLEPGQVRKSHAPIRKKSLPKLAELVNSEPVPPVASAPPASPQLHPPTHRSAAGLEAAQERSRAALAPVAIEKPAPPVKDAGTVWAGSARCQFPMWGDNERVPKPPRFCDAPCPRGQSWCEKCVKVVFTRTAGWGQRSPLHEVKRADPAGGDSADAFLNPA